MVDYGVHSIVQSTPVEIPYTNGYSDSIYTVIHNYRTPGFQRHNLVNMWFVYTKLSRPQREIMLCKVLSEFPKYVLPLPCNICINVTSWDGLINV